MRIVKDPIVRKNEILDAAEHLFVTNGYNETSIADIVKEVDVAKGTFYYYFQSKDEILDEVLLRLIAEDEKRMLQVLNDMSLAPIQKMLLMIAAQTPQSGSRKDRMTEEFHRPGNAEMHQKGTRLAIKRLAPILAKAVIEGIEQGIFTTKTPLEDMEMILITSSVMFDEELTAYEPEDIPKKAAAFFSMMERLLGAKPGTFNEMMETLLAMDEEKTIDS